jgi:hypothetical protein
MAELHMNMLAEQLNSAELKDVLTKLPTEIDETYKQAVHRIDGYSSKMKELAMTVLM